MRQKVGDSVTSSRDSKSVRCKEGTTTWSATTYSSRAYRSGAAGVWLTVTIPSHDRKRSVKKIVQLASCGQCI
jgi:hypothetical protein